MKTVITGAVALFLAFGVASTVSANCADDAVNTCNKKHPDPNKSDHAYELYDLCIKAQLGQKCPSNSSAGNAAIRDAQTTKRRMQQPSPTRMKPISRQ